jgi:hypothetical protein
MAGRQQQDGGQEKGNRTAGIPQTAELYVLYHKHFLFVLMGKTTILL